MATEMGCKIHFEEDANSVFVITSEPEGGTNVYETMAIDPCESGVKFDHQTGGVVHRVFVPWGNVERLTQEVMGDVS